MTLQDLKIDSTWSLFLDRDGVINKRIVDGYVKTYEQFEFLPGVLDALTIFPSHFNRIIVVSNQQGVGKGLMTIAQLDSVHQQMLIIIMEAGGRIDGIYFSPHLEKEGSFFRKPNIGMALKARKEFPGTRLRKSIMAGDSLSDMAFGKRAGMNTVFLSPEPSLAKKNPRLIDFIYPDLISFAHAL